MVLFPFGEDWGWRGKMLEKGLGRSVQHHPGRKKTSKVRPNNALSVRMGPDLQRGREDITFLNSNSGPRTDSPASVQRKRER